MNAEVQQEFLGFVEARSATLMRVAYALSGHQQSAEDLVQIALERLVVRWRQVEDPENYARRIMYHEYLSWWRRWGRREFVTADVDERPAPDDQETTILRRQSVIAALRQLGPRQRAVLVLRYLEDRSEAEVAEMLGCSVKTVSSQATRALAKLRLAYPGPIEPALLGVTA